MLSVQVGFSAEPRSTPKEGEIMITRCVTPLVLIVVGITQYHNWEGGFITACGVCMISLPLIDHLFGVHKMYRRWYLMCRNELERIDPENKVLADIGPRTSKRESWES